MSRRFFIKVVTFFTAIFSFIQVNAQSPSADKMQWFKDAKLGIFIHWGIYSVNGLSESWSFFNNYIPYEDYKKQINHFTAEKYNPQQWVSLIKDAGAKYAVITTKHHEGVSLWDTKQPGALSIPKHSPAKRDVLTPFVKELKKSGLKTGFYYSLPDWSHNDYDIFTSTIKRYDYKKEPQRFNTFINHYQNQLRELSTQFKPDLLWFDGDWEHSAEEWKAAETRRLLESYNKNIIINSRLKDHGDYATPEQGIPVQQPESEYWELCYTMNDSWGYQPFDDKYKSSNQLIRTLVDCIALGGNLLLDIGPKADGTIPQKQIDILKDLGRWTNKHAEAIYGTVPFTDGKHIFDGRTATKKDSSFFYVYLDYKPNGYVTIKNPAFVSGDLGLVQSIEVVGNNRKLNFEVSESDYIIQIPENLVDKDVTVLKVNYSAPQLISYSPVAEFAYLKDKTQNPQITIHKIIQDVKKGSNPFKQYNITVNNTGSLPAYLQPQVKQWITKHAEVMGNGIAGISNAHFAGATALSPDKQTLYLFVEGKPTGPVLVKGLNNNVARIRIVGEGTIINDFTVFDKLYWNTAPGLLSIRVPENRIDKNVTVIAILLDGPISLYSGEVKAIESNL